MLFIITLDVKDLSQLIFFINYRGSIMKHSKVLIFFVACLLAGFFFSPIFSVILGFVQANVYWLAILSSIVIASLLSMIIIIIVIRIRNEIIFRQVKAAIDKINKKMAEAGEEFAKEVRSGQVGKATCRCTYNFEIDYFDIRVASDILNMMLKTWHYEEDVKVLDNISSYARGWINYLAKYTDNKSLSQALMIYIDLLIQADILQEQEYGNLIFFLQNKQEEKIKEMTFAFE